MSGTHSLCGNISNVCLYAGHLWKLRRLAPSEVWAFYPARIMRWWLKWRKNNDVLSVYKCTLDFGD